MSRTRDTQIPSTRACRHREIQWKHCATCSCMQWLKAALVSMAKGRLYLAHKSDSRAYVCIIEAQIACPNDDRPRTCDLIEQVRQRWGRGQISGLHPLRLHVATTTFVECRHLCMGHLAGSSLVISLPFHRRVDNTVLHYLTLSILSFTILLFENSPHLVDVHRDRLRLICGWVQANIIILSKIANA